MTHSFLFLIVFGASVFASANDATSAAPGMPKLPLTDAFQYLGIAEHVSLESFEGSIQGYELSCEQNSNNKIGFCGGDCNSDVGSQDGATISKQCAEFVDAFIPKCLIEIGCTDAAAFCGVGGHAKRSINNPNSPKSTKPSRHSTGDALDLFGLRCKGPKGQDVNLDFSTQGRNSNPINKQKYDTFVACWRRQVEEYKQQGQGKGGGAIACQGSIPPANELHNDHVHISCPVKRNNVAGT